MSQENLQVVKQFYEAFSRGDLGAILDTLDEDVVWETAFPSEVIPHGGRWESRRGVKHFFNVMYAAENVEKFEVREFICGDNQVAVVGFSRIKVNYTGLVYENDWVIVWTLKDGKVIKYREFADSVPARVAFGLT